MRAGSGLSELVTPLGGIAAAQIGSWWGCSPRGGWWFRCVRHRRGYGVPASLEDEAAVVVSGDSTAPVDCPVRHYVACREGHRCAIRRGGTELFDRRMYEEHRPRHEYRLTEKRCDVQVVPLVDGAIRGWLGNDRRPRHVHPHGSWQSLHGRYRPVRTAAQSLGSARPGRIGCVTSCSSVLPPPRTPDSATAIGRPRCGISALDCH